MSPITKLKKYKYYFRKPKSEIAKDILKGLAIAGGFLIVASSKRFWWDFWLRFFGLKKPRVYPREKVKANFYSLLRGGYIKVEKRGKQIYISLTEKGKAKASWMQIDELKIKRPKKWDGRWRIVVFDISQLRKIYREAFRGKLKELGFFPLQKSVWICPFDCEAEIELLRDFFGFSQEELRLIVAKEIGPDKKLKEIFKI